MRVRDHKLLPLGRCSLRRVHVSVACLGIEKLSHELNILSSSCPGTNGPADCRSTLLHYCSSSSISIEGIDIFSGITEIVP